MKPKYWIATGLVGSAVILGGMQIAAEACTCAYSPPIKRLQTYSMVFVGSVVDEVEYDDVLEREINGEMVRYDNRVVRYRFKVKAVWKGEQLDTVDVVTSAYSSACGRSFERGIDFIVYAYDRGDQLGTGTCSGCQDVTKAVFDRYCLGTPMFVVNDFELQEVEFEDLFLFARNADQKVRASAIRALGYLENERELISPRLQHMIREGDKTDQMAAVLAFKYMRGAGKEYLADVVYAFSNGSDDVRAEAANTIVAIVGRKEYYPYVLKAAEDPSSRVVIRAISQVPCMRECMTPNQKESLVPILLRLYDSPDPTLRGHAILGLKGCSEFALELLPMLDQIAIGDPDDWVKYCAKTTARSLRREFERDH